MYTDHLQITKSYINLQLVLQEYNNTYIIRVFKRRCSYLFKHVAGSVASPLHMVEC